MDAEARLAALERRVAALYNEPDPGLPCPMASLGLCLNGRDNRCHSEGGPCKTCAGKGRVFPKGYLGINLDLLPLPPRPQS